LGENRSASPLVHARNVKLNYREEEETSKDHLSLLELKLPPTQKGAEVV